MPVPTPDSSAPQFVQADLGQSAPLELFFLRHGRTVVNSQGRLQGRTDDPLDDLGRAQAKAVGVWVRDHRLSFDAVVSSPLLRARQTAALALGLGLDQAEGIATDDLLLEMDYGPYEGFDFRHQEPDPALAAFFADFAHNPAPQGMEGLDQVKARGALFLDRCLDRYATWRKEGRGEPVRVLVVCHAIILKGILEDLDPSLGGSWWSTYLGTCWTFRTRLDPKAGPGGAPAFRPAELVFKGDEAVRGIRSDHD